MTKRKPPACDTPAQPQPHFSRFSYGVIRSYRHFFSTFLPSNTRNPATQRRSQATISESSNSPLPTSYHTALFWVIVPMPPGKLPIRSDFVTPNRSGAPGRVAWTIGRFCIFSGFKSTLRVNFGLTISVQHSARRLRTPRSTRRQSHHPGAQGNLPSKK